MVDKREKKAMELFEFGYQDTVIAARAELELSKVKELRQLFVLFKEKK